jgi:hypothetical protein
MNHGRLVGALIIQDEMDIKRIQYGSVNSIEECSKFRRSIATMHFANDFPFNPEPALGVISYQPFGPKKHR